MYEKQEGTYDIPVRGEVSDTTHRPLGTLKQEMYEVDNKAHWGHISILRHEGLISRLQEVVIASYQTK